MIRYQKDMSTNYSEKLRGGEGITAMMPLFEGKMPHLRLLSVITLKPGCSIGSHLHEKECEVYYILEGEATVIEGENARTIYAGDAHLCRDGEAHALSNKGEQDLRVLAIIPTLAE